MPGWYSGANSGHCFKFGWRSPVSQSRIREKLHEYQTALNHFLERVEEDEKILAVVQNGRLDEETIWRRESLHLWLIEIDGVTKRLRFDGNDERIFRTFFEEGINIHAEMIPRSRFRQMVEGSARTAFSCNFFAERKMIYCREPSIKKWFEQANRVAVKDQEKEKLAVATWVIWGCRQLKKRLEFKKDLQQARLDLLGIAHSIAAFEVVQQGEVYEGELIERGLELNPELLEKIYLQALAKKPTRKFLDDSLELVLQFLDEKLLQCVKPILSYLKKQKRTVAFSELCDHFAYSQLYPWHLESACDWLEEIGELEKDSAPFKMTKKSRANVEEPAYLLNG